MIISRTPLRISFFGGGTDFYEYYSSHVGRVISTTINKYIYVIIFSRYDDLIVLNYSKKEIVNSVDEIKHELIKESLKKTGITKAVEITTLADIPSEGSGLGSSSSLTVGLLNALYTFQGIKVDPERLAREACEIEINLCKKPIGKQDQYIAAYGGFCDITFNKNDSVNINRISLNKKELDELNSNLFLLYTGITRKSEQILEEQRQNIYKKLRQLNIIKTFVDTSIKYLIRSEFDKVGLLLDKAWNLKKQLSSNVSNELLEEIYSISLKSGALGGKILGAGGGGFFLIYAKRENKLKVKSSLIKYKELPFKFEKDGSKIILNKN